VSFAMMVLHCRLLASKAAQALLLLRTIAAANINRLVNRLDNDSRRALMDLVRLRTCLTPFLHHPPLIRHCKAPHSHHM